MNEPVGNVSGYRCVSDSKSANLGVTSSIPAQFPTFLEIDHEIIYTVIRILMPLKYHVFENIMENGALNFALLEQMLHFP